MITMIKPPLTVLVLIILNCFMICSIMGEEEMFQVIDNRATMLNKRSPLEIGSRNSFDSRSNKWTSTTKDDSYLYSSDSNNGAGGGSKNASWKVFTGNPDEYTIGGVLSGAPVEFYFTQVLSVSILVHIQFLLT